MSPVRPVSVVRRPSVRGKSSFLAFLSRVSTDKKFSMTTTPRADDDDEDDDDADDEEEEIDDTHTYIHG